MGGLLSDDSFLNPFNPPTPRQLIGRLTGDDEPKKKGKGDGGSSGGTLLTKPLDRAKDDIDFTKSLLGG